MAYQVLARRWRPQTFDSLKGQWHVVRALMNSIARGQYHHAYLLTGTRGVGKTTIARILAKAFNCEVGITATPCGKCATCQEIEAGRFMDLLEVDAASRTRVEDTRELLENVQYAPTQGRFKVYLIDEVHMLSGHSFNALLKTLEEPPPHVIFILATTDPERIPITVLSRCLRFNLRPLSTVDIHAQLNLILEKEQIDFEPMALEKIARLAQGSMRDALSLLEQAMAFCEGKITTDAVEDMLGISYERHIPALLEAIIVRDVASVLAITQEMANQGTDFEQVCSSLQRALYALSMLQQIKREEMVLSLLEIEPSVLLLKDKIDPEALSLLYQILLIGKRDLPHAPDLKTGFDMVALRMMVFRPISVDSAAPQKIEKPVVAKRSEPAVVTRSEIKQEKKTETLEWSSMISQLSLTGLSAVLVKHCVVASWDGERLALTLDAIHKACLNDTRMKQIQEAISQYLGRTIRVKITPGEVQTETPSQQREAALQGREAEAMQSIQQDAMVKNILSTFEAKVEQVTLIKEE